MKIKDWKIVKWAKRHKWLTRIFLVLLALYIISHNWIYHGRVFDAETGKPIEGAVVVAKWDWMAAGIAGPNDSLKDVKETLTDKDGRWLLRGQRPLLDEVLPYLVFIPYTQQPDFIVYKPGYCPWRNGFHIEACRGGGLSPGDQADIRAGATVKLPKLTKREDRRMVYPGPFDEIDDKSKRIELLKKQKNFIRLINQEMRYLGLREYDYAFLKENNNEK